MKDELCPQDWNRCPVCSTDKIEVRHCKILKRGDINPVNGLLFMGGNSFKPYNIFRKLWCIWVNWECGI